MPGVTIDASSGEVTLSNTTQSPFDMDLYRMSGPAGSLNPSGWNSLESTQVNAGQDLSVFPRGDNNGNGWEELGTPSSESLSEAFLTGSSELAPADAISLGNAFNPAGPGEGAINFQVRTPSGGLFDLDIEYINGGGGLLCDLDSDLDCDNDDIKLLYATNPDATGIANWLSQASAAANPYKTTYPGGTVNDTYVLGDVNLDGNVTSADLGLLLNNFGSTASLDWADGNLNADTIVNSADLGLLLNNFSFSSPSTVAVPEPGTAVLAFLSLLCVIGMKRRW